MFEVTFKVDNLNSVIPDPITNIIYTKLKWRISSTTWSNLFLTKFKIVHVQLFLINPSLFYVVVKCLRLHLK